MRNVVFTVGTVLTLLALACRKPVALRYVERAGSIVSEVTSDHKVLHDAQSGQTIEWQAEGSGGYRLLDLFGNGHPVSKWSEYSSRICWSSSFVCRRKAGWWRWAGQVRVRST